LRQTIVPFFPLLSIPDSPIVVSLFAAPVVFIWSTFVLIPRFPKIFVKSARTTADSNELVSFPLCLDVFVVFDIELSAMLPFLNLCSCYSFSFGRISYILSLFLWRLTWFGFFVFFFFFSTLHFSLSRALFSFLLSRATLPGPRDCGDEHWYVLPFLNPCGRLFLGPFYRITFWTIPTLFPVPFFPFFSDSFFLFPPRSLPPHSSPDPNPRC